MKHIRKSSSEPWKLADYRSRFAAAPRAPAWKQFTSDPRRREPVKQLLRTDQRALCAYCESRLVPSQESIEHFIPRSVDHALELDWPNLLLCCDGGEGLLSEDPPGTPSGRKAHAHQTCGHAKGRNPGQILNPLMIPPFPRLFRFVSETGEIQADEAQCRLAGVDASLAEQTITVLNLRAGR